MKINKFTPLIALMTLLLALREDMLSATPLSSTFVFSGRLDDGGNPANGAYDFRISLFDDPTVGSIVGVGVSKDDIAVSNGLFSVELDFGNNSFDGNARWLEIEVRPGASTGAFTKLSPRQFVTPTPYSLYALKAATAGMANNIASDSVTSASIQNGSITSAKLGTGQVVKSLNGLMDNVTLSAGANVTLTPSANSIQISSSGSGGMALPFKGSEASPDPMFIVNNTGNGYALYGSSTSGKYGIYGDTSAAAFEASGVYGINLSLTGQGTGVYGVALNSPKGTGVAGRASAVGGYFQATNSTGEGIIGISPAGNGVRGDSGDGSGVFGRSQSGSGVFGQSMALFNGTGVLGRYDGVGQFDGGNGVYGYCATVGVGVLGISEGGDGVSGRSNSGGKSGVFGYTEIRGSHGGYFKNNSTDGPGLAGESIGGTGVEGYSTSGWGLFARSQSNIGVFGQTLANGAAGVLGRNDGPTGAGGQAVSGYASSGAVGVRGVSEGNDGVSGRSNGQGKSGVFGYTEVPSSYGGSFYNAATGGISLKVFGNAAVDVLTILGGADVAEPFQMSTPEVPKGSVVV